MRMLTRFIFAVIALACFAGTALPAQQGRMIPENIEWTWEVTPDQPQPDLPNVLLVGDSITRNYFPSVAKHLSGKANVYLFATSASLGDPRLEAQLREFFAMEGKTFRVVHFNNGMHGWKFTEQEYRAAFPGLLHALKAGAPQAKLVWANITPVRKDNLTGATNARIDARNQIASVFTSRRHIPVDDQHAIVAAHPAWYSDDVHPNAALSELQGQAAARSIEGLL